MTRKAVVLVLGILLFSCSKGPERQAIPHPIKNPPLFTKHTICENCGMDRNKFARTRYSFVVEDGTEHYTCSLHCLAVWLLKTGHTAKKIKVALYLHPDRMVPVEKAVYIIGSKARGTMTKVSKLAFADKKEAETFVKRFGGKISTFQQAYQLTLKEIRH